jgi:hypothetical protein
MRLPRLLPLTLLLGAAHAGAADLHDYAYAFRIDTPSGVSSSAWRIDLTPAVYAHVQDAGLRDIAVFNAEGQAVPFARAGDDPALRAREHTEQVPLLALPARNGIVANDLSLVIERDADGRLRRLDAGDKKADAPAPAASDWVLDASAVNGAIERVVLTWEAPATGVVARFEIAAGDDLQNWRHVGVGTVLSLRQGEAHLDRRDILLADVRAKYLRLHRVDDGVPLQDLYADVRVVEQTPVTPERNWIDAGNTAPTAQKKEELPVAARYEYTLPAALPVEMARIELAHDNALAALTLSADDEGRWTELARLTAFRLKSGGDTLRNGDVDLSPSSRVRAFRLDAATPLAAPPHLAFAFRPDRFVFLAEGAGPWTLAVGTRRARRPDYPLDAALASLRANLGQDWQPPRATIGDARVSAGDAALQSPPLPTPWRQWLLWAVLVLGAALVGTFALSLLRGARDKSA